MYTFLFEFSKNHNHLIPDGRVSLHNLEVTLHELLLVDVIEPKRFLLFKLVALSNVKVCTQSYT